MSVASKNARAAAGTQKFFCSCGGEIKMRSLFVKGKMRHLAECGKCKRQERRPAVFS